MQVPVFSRRGAGYKPPGLPRLNYNHPLMTGIYSFIPFTEGGGSPIDYAFPVFGQNILTANSSPGWGLGGSGNLCGSVTGGSNYATSSTSWWYNMMARAGDPATPTGDFTFRIVFTPSWSTNFTTICDDASRNFSLFFDTNGNYDFLVIDHNTMGASGTAVTGLNMSSGQRWDHVIVATGGTLYFYVNGVQKNTLAGIHRPAGANAVTKFGSNISGGGANFTGKYELIQAWTRALQPEDVLALYNDPYAGLIFPEDDIFAELVGVVAGGFTAKFRRTLSPIGSRVGSRQTHGWGA